MSTSRNSAIKISRKIANSRAVRRSPRIVKPAGGSISACWRRPRRASDAWLVECGRLN